MVSRARRGWRGLSFSDKAGPSSETDPARGPQAALTYCAVEFVAAASVGLEDVGWDKKWVLGRLTETGDVWKGSLETHWREGYNHKRKSVGMIALPVLTIPLPENVGY